MKTSLIFFLILAAGFAHAGSFIEFYLGAKTETTKLTDLANSVSEIRASTPAIGLKMGFRSQMGIDVNLSGEKTSGQATVTNQTEKSKFSHTTGAFQFGVNALGNVKMYLGTSFLNEFTLEDSPGLQGFTLSGPSYQVGLQYKVFQMINVGLQYNLNQFTTVTGPAFIGDSRIETYFLKTDSQDYSIYLSTSF